MTSGIPQGASLRRRLEAQGYVGLDDDTLHGLDPWLRLAPFVTGLFTALGAATGTWIALAAMAFLHGLGVFLPRHPVEELYNHFIRPLEDGSAPAIPASPWRRRLVHAVLTALLTAAAWCFVAGWPRTGTTLGWVIATHAGVQAAHNLCFLSEGLQRLFGPPASS